MFGLFYIILLSCGDTHCFAIYAEGTVILEPSGFRIHGEKQFKYCSGKVFTYQSA